MNRNYGIDLLRGLAIIGMVLAAVIPWTAHFPGWMYHAQVGPPDFTFNPNTPGITWVDLVFPFFLFAMGAAFPLALRKKLDNGDYVLILQGLLRRGVLLLFFALALAYLSPDNLTSTSPVNYLSTLITFGCFFLVFLRFKGSKLKRYGLQALGFVIVAILVYYHSEILGNTFSKSKSNIIILVLANMAVFGSIFWMLTANNLLLRSAVILAFMGVWFSKDISNSWTQTLWNFHPDIHWFYNFSFLKYLCIVLPGSVLGDLLISNGDVANRMYTNGEKRKTQLLAVICFVFVAFHVFTLYMRTLTLNLWGHALFGVLFYALLRKEQDGVAVFYKKLIGWGFALVSIGLFFEPLDGGIKKDPSSFSYWFLTSGLAFIFFVMCDYLTKVYPKNLAVSSVVKNGQNPMIAYCVSSFCITPVLGLLHISPVFDTLSHQSPYLGLVKTVVYVVLVVIITNYATNKKWFWRS